MFILGKIVRSSMKNAVYVSNAFLADCSVILEDVTITAQAGQGKIPLKGIIQVTLNSI